MPITPIPCQVYSKKEKEIIVFTKLRPFEDWGKYEFDVRIEDPSTHRIPQSSRPPVEGNSNNFAHFPDDTFIVGPKVKSCPTCTFDNDDYLNFCECCGNQL